MISRGLRFIERVISITEWMCARGRIKWRKRMGYEGGNRDRIRIGARW